MERGVVPQIAQRAQQARMVRFLLQFAIQHLESVFPPASSRVQFNHQVPLVNFLEALRGTYEGAQRRHGVRHFPIQLPS